MGGVAGIGMSLVSTGIGAFGAYRNAQAQNDMISAQNNMIMMQSQAQAEADMQAAEFNAKEYEIQAQQIRNRGMFDLTLLRKDHKQNLSALAQGISNSGVEGGSGSAVRLLASQHGMDVRAEEIQQANTELEATGSERRATLTRATGASSALLNTANAAAQITMNASKTTNPWAAAGQTLLGGTMATYNQYSKYRMYTSAGGYGTGFW